VNWGVGAGAGSGSGSASRTYVSPQPTAADPKHAVPPSWGAGTGTGSGTGAACVIVTLIAKAMTVALKLKSMIEVFFGTEFERSVELCRIVVYF